MLPQGCPFVIGGGLIRDAILGGRPSDVDIWLPSNIAIPDIDQFVAAVRRRTYAWQINTMFIGPGAHTAGRAPTNPFENEAQGAPDYGDVNNHWVIEASISPTTPNLNFMRSMTPWTGDSQAFFNGLMRAFDIDYCMFFVGYMPGVDTCNTVIMPQHMATPIVTGREMVGPRGSFSLNSLYWNRYRLDNTSQARIEARFDKMCSKYNFPGIGRLIGGGITREDINVIETEAIVAVPVELRRVMFRADAIREARRAMPFPTETNRQQRVIPDDLLETLIRQRRA